MQEKKWFKVYAHYRTDVEPAEYDVLAENKRLAKRHIQDKLEWLKVFDVKEMEGMPHKDIYIW